LPAPELPVPAVLSRRVPGRRRRELLAAEVEEVRVGQGAVGGLAAVVLRLLDVAAAPPAALLLDELNELPAVPPVPAGHDLVATVVEVLEDRARQDLVVREALLLKLPAVDALRKPPPAARVAVLDRLERAVAHEGLRVQRLQLGRLDVRAERPAPARPLDGRPEVGRRHPALRARDADALGEARAPLLLAQQRLKLLLAPAV
ncbi:MAG: hypothetical protein BJ554DRAFT_5066, partial [Olpidium bornovanus]